jgi:hypothetical protein
MVVISRNDVGFHNEIEKVTAKLVMDYSKGE